MGRLEEVFLQMPCLTYLPEVYSCGPSKTESVAEDLVKQCYGKIFIGVLVVLLLYDA